MSTIHFLYQLNVIQGHGELELTPTVFGREAGYTLDQTPVHYRANTETKCPKALKLTPRVNLESPINQTNMFLDSGRKLEYLEKTHAYMGRRCKLHPER